MLLTSTLVLLGCSDIEIPPIPVDMMTDGDTTMSPTTSGDDASTGSASTTMTMTMTGVDSTGGSTGDGDSTGEGEESSSGAGSDSSSSGGEDLCVVEDLGDTIPQMIMGDNTGGGDDATPGCAAGGEDTVYEFTAPADGWYRFDTVGSSFDTTLSLLDACGGAELLCNDNAGGDTDSVIEVELAMGEVVTLAVEGSAGEVGSFSLTIDQIVFADPPMGFCSGELNGPAGCMMPGGGTAPKGGSVPCDVTGAGFFFDIYEIAVADGDCVSLSVDNIDPVMGATGLEAGDMMLVARDPMNNPTQLDDEMLCTDPAFGEYACPSGELVAAGAGTLSIGVSQYGGAGCPDPTPYTLEVSINGVDVDLSAVAPIFDDGELLCEA